MIEYLKIANNLIDNDGNINITQHKGVACDLEFLETLQAWNPLQISPDIILNAERLCDSYAFSPYDAIHIQAALELDCRYFLSEDLQDGLVVQGTLTISNPF